jgi:hypothetical protein
LFSKSLNGLWPLDWVRSAKLASFREMPDWFFLRERGAFHRTRTWVWLGLLSLGFWPTGIVFDGKLEHNKNKVNPWKLQHDSAERGSSPV